ncbi:MAG: hypothetical protein RMJ31_07485, partial [Nitrososphaerota archaeon]|nr:hypothetical protein [Nitrososphaerota archaeon]
NYQIANSYIKIDEWQPLSTKYSPRISIWTGASYEPVLYLDDSFLKVNMTLNGKSIIEAPYKASLYRSEWVKKNDEEAILKITFRTDHLLTTKSITMQANKSEVYISYVIKAANPNSTISSITLPLWVDWTVALKEVKIVGDKAFITTNKGSVEVNYQGNVKKITHEIDPEFKQNKVSARFEVNSKFANIAIQLRSLRIENSWVKGLWAKSFNEVAKEYGVSYFVVRKDSKSLQHFNVQHPKGEILYIDDAYARVRLIKAGKEWIEAPYKATITKEEIVGKNYIIKYRTIALHITKCINQTIHNERMISYTIQSLNDTELRSFQLKVWLTWGRQIKDVEIFNDVINIITDAGAIKVASIKGDLTNLHYGLDEEYNVPRIKLEYKLKQKEDTIIIKLSCLNDWTSINHTIKKTTRPVMEKSDRIIFSIEDNYPIKVFENPSLIVYGLKRL